MPTDAGCHWPLRPIVLLVGAAALSLALAHTVATPAAERTAAAADTHAYPRTYHIYGYGPLDELARYDMIVGTSYFDIPGLRSRNPNGIFLLHPGLAVPGV